MLSRRPCLSPLPLPLSSLLLPLLLLLSYASISLAILLPPSLFQNPAPLYLVHHAKPSSSHPSSSSSSPSLHNSTATNTNTSANASPPRSHAHPLRSSKPARIIVGTFVADCENSSWFVPSAPQGINVSAAETFQYWDNGTYAVDYTEYIGDGMCTPLTSAIFAKYYLQGSIIYHGINSNFPNSTTASWAVSSSTWLFPPGIPEAQELVDALNQYCPCSGFWQAGVPRNVDASSCDVGVGTIPYICALISGLPAYGSYLWTDTRTFISSPLYFDPDQGYAVVPNSSPRHRLPQTGDTAASDCDYILWANCGQGIQSASSLCDTCVTSLECAGCVYRLLPSVQDRDSYGECCPCLWYYSERYQVPWMSLPC